MTTRAPAVLKTSQELRMLSRSPSDCRSLLLNLNVNLNCCLCSDCSDCSDCSEKSEMRLKQILLLSKIKNLWLTDRVTRSPIELSWTAKNQLTCQTGNQRSRKNSLKFNLCDGELWKWNCIVKEKLQKRDQIWKSRGGHRRCWRAPSRRIQRTQTWRRPAFVWKSKQIDTGWRLLFFFQTEMQLGSTLQKPLCDGRWPIWFSFLYVYQCWDL